MRELSLITNEYKKYKLAYYEVMQYWDSINEEDRFELDQRLNQIFGEQKWSVKNVERLMETYTILDWTIVEYGIVILTIGTTYKIYDGRYIQGMERSWWRIAS